MTEANTKDPKAARAETWVLCTERLPPYMEDVLVFDGKAIYKGFRHHTNGKGEWWGIVGNEDRQFNDITHWIDLPEPPK